MLKTVLIAVALSAAFDGLVIALVHRSAPGRADLGWLLIASSVFLMMIGAGLMYYGRSDSDYKDIYAPKRRPEVYDELGEVRGPLELGEWAIVWGRVIAIGAFFSLIVGAVLYYGAH